MRLEPYLAGEISWDHGSQIHGPAELPTNNGQWYLPKTTIMRGGREYALCQLNSCMMHLDRMIRAASIMHGRQSTYLGMGSASRLA